MAKTSCVVRNERRKKLAAAGIVLTPEQDLPIVPKWHPHQLRHNAGTRFRREYGLETAKCLLGQKTLDAAQIYAEQDVQKAREIPRWRESDLFTPLERDVLEYAEAMSQTPPTVTDDLSARLLEAPGAPALVELSAFIALANVYTRTNIAFGIEAQGFAAACGLQPLAEPSRSVASAS